LLEITRLSDDEFTGLIADGTINAAATRKNIILARRRLHEEACAAATKTIDAAVTIEKIEVPVPTLRARTIPEEKIFISEPKGKLTLPKSLPPEIANLIESTPSANEEYSNCNPMLEFQAVIENLAREFAIDLVDSVLNGKKKKVDLYLLNRFVDTLLDVVERYVQEKSK
jgi:hypothetical protein